MASKYNSELCVLKETDNYYSYIGIKKNVLEAQGVAMFTSPDREHKEYCFAAVFYAVGHPAFGFCGWSQRTMIRSSIPR